MGFSRKLKFLRRLWRPDDQIFYPSLSTDVLYTWKFENVLFYGLELYYAVTQSYGYFHAIVVEGLSVDLVRQL